jgi:hypothetical protein
LPRTPLLLLLRKAAKERPLISIFALRKHFMLRIAQYFISAGYFAIYEANYFIFLDPCCTSGVPALHSGHSSGE